jgi:hypothetical protein
MILVTDEPMEGVAFDVQDHARRTCTIWTGTHREMINSDLHGAEEPTKWMLRPHQGVETGQRMIIDFSLEKKRMFHQRHPNTAWPKGIHPFSEGRWLYMDQDVTRRLMTSS